MVVERPVPNVGHVDSPGDGSYLHDCVNEKNRGSALGTGQSLLEDPHLASWAFFSPHPLFEPRLSLDDVRDVRDAIKYVK